MRHPTRFEGSTNRMTGPRARVRMSEKHGAVAIGQRMLPVMSGGRMLERETELARLEGLLGAVGASGGRVVLVRGPAGIGKSALIARFLHDVANQSEVHLGACDDLGTPQPLGPVWDVARRSPPVAAMLAQGERRGVMDALLDLLSDPFQPAVVVFEDTQWADEATLDVIKFLGRRIGRANGLLVLTYRDDEVDSGHPLRQVLGELPPGYFVRIRLEPLSLEAITALIGDGSLDPEEVLALTGGNPLFVSEVIATGSVAVPSSVHDAVLARVAKLSTGARRIAELVSILPGGCEWALVDKLLDPAPEEPHACVRQGLLQVDDDHLRFCHELQRRAVEASLLPDMRRALHQRVLAHLAGQGDVARLVHHARAAGDHGALMAFAPQAARTAIAAGSHREALAHFRAVGPYLDRLPVADAASIAEDWVRTAFHFGSTDAFDVLPRAVALRRAAGDRRALGQTLAFGVMVLESSGRPEKANAYAAEAIEILEALPPGRELSYALTERARLHLLRGDHPWRGIEVADRAIAIADAVEDDSSAASALMLKGVLLHNERDPRGVPLIEEAHDRAARGGHRFEETDALLTLAGKAGDVRDLSRALDLVERARNTAARYELWPLEIFARVMHAELLLWTGDWAAAEDEASQVLGAQPETEPIAWRILATIEARRGRSESGASIERMWSTAQVMDEMTVMDPAAGVVAEYLWLTGNDDPEWLASLEHVLERGLRSGVTWPSGAFAFWMWKLGRLAAVPAYLPDCYRWTMVGQHGRAAAFWAAEGAAFDQALALMHGGDEEAVQAVRIFEELGADGSAQRFRAELRHRGVRVPRGRSRSSRGHVAGLTVRQAEILNLLAEGLSNVEIADRLFLSHRTVENHVAAVLMKLDVASRRAAVSAARTRGLLDTA